MSEVNKYPGQLVFGLDIGTRSIVGTVGYKIGEKLLFFQEFKNLVGLLKRNAVV